MKSAGFNSILLALIASFMITWVNEATSLHTWSDLVSFIFVTKFVGTLVTLSGMNIYLAKQSFRPDDSLTRQGEVNEITPKNTDIRKLLNFKGVK